MWSVPLVLFPFRFPNTLHQTSQLHNTLNGWRSKIGEKAIIYLQEEWAMLGMDGDVEEIVNERVAWVEGQLRDSRFMYKDFDNKVSPQEH